eukprot:9174160-Pyramimonas_sp.AAC.1
MARVGMLRPEDGSVSQLKITGMMHESRGSVRSGPVWFDVRLVPFDRFRLAASQTGSVRRV